MDLQNHTPEQLLEYVRARLKLLRGDYAHVAQATGIPYFTLSKIANGATPDPRISTFIPLLNALRNHELTGNIALPPTRKIPSRRTAKAHATPKP